MRVPRKATGGFERVNAATRQRAKALPQQRRPAVFLAFALVLFLSGCGWRGRQADHPSQIAQTNSRPEKDPRPAPPGAALTEQAAALIHARVATWFPNALLFKPVPHEPADLAWTLAPLIIQEASDDNRSVSPFGSTTPETPDPRTSPPSPNVHFASDVIQIRGHFHPRFTYWWPSPPAASPPGDISAVQGVRLTLDSNGAPVIWELLADPTGADVIFVARSLEQAAQKEFGGPLAGRRFAIETALSNAPNTVVARVIDDGPVPMGPILYLSADGGTIRTLICRCMPAQAGHLVSTSYYQLVNRPLPLMPPPPTSDALAPQTGSSPHPSPTAFHAPIQSRLRLPTQF